MEKHEFSDWQLVSHGLEVDATGSDMAKAEQALERLKAKFAAAPGTPIEKAAREYVEAERNFIDKRSVRNPPHVRMEAEESRCAAWTNLCVAVDGSRASLSSLPQEIPQEARDAVAEVAKNLEAIGKRVDPIVAKYAPQAQEETSSVNEKENMTQEELFLKEVLAEIHRARGLFPTPDGLICAAGEEFGEVCKAYLDESKTRVREECVQLAAMAARITLEGDPTLEGYRAKRGADKET